MDDVDKSNQIVTYRTGGAGYIAYGPDRRAVWEDVRAIDLIKHLVAQGYSRDNIVRQDIRILVVR